MAGQDSDGTSTAGLPLPLGEGWGEGSHTSSFRGGAAFVALLERCRQLRQHATDAEQLLWRLLRDRQVAGAKFRRQHQYGPYILDFFSAEHKLAVEADGGQHFSINGVMDDAARTRYLQANGIRVLRFSNTEVLQQTEDVTEAIWRAVALPATVS